MGATGSIFKGTHGTEYTLPTKLSNFNKLSNNAINLTKEKNIGVTYKKPTKPRVTNPNAGLKVYVHYPTKVPNVPITPKSPVNLSLYFPNKQSTATRIAQKWKPETAAAVVAGGKRTLKNKKRN